MNKFLLIVIPFAFFVTGCATVGSGEFTCSGLDESGVKCIPASDLYNEVDKSGFGKANANSSLNNNVGALNGRKLSRQNLSRRDSGKPETSHDTRTGKAGEKYFGNLPVVPSTNPDQLFLLNPPLADGTDPIRKSADLRKIWIAPWVDRKGAYHSEQSIFIDITSASWANGEQNTSKTPIFRPLDN